MAIRNPVFRALDIGLGHVKYSKEHHKIGNELNVGTFPSVAVEGTFEQTRSMNQLNVRTVKVGKQCFIVGEDAKKASGAMTKQLLDKTYYTSDQYVALGYGALAKMEIPAHGIVDKLVMGLPLTVISDKAINEHITRHFSGSFGVPNDDGDDERLREVQVQKLLIIPQVVGSLLAMSMDTKLGAVIEDKRNLTIDVGYGTLLWLVSIGMDAEPSRSKGNMGGVSNLLQRLLKTMNPGCESSVVLLERLDKVLREKLPTMRIAETEYVMADYEPQIHSAIRENMQDVFRSVGDHWDYDNIFLTGGGAPIYKDGIQKLFPNRTVSISSKDSRFLNVRGFQYLAEMGE